MPAYKNATNGEKKKQSKVLKQKRASEDGYKHDDTPRAFARMMQFQGSKKRPRSGLDDGSESRKAKKARKLETTASESTQDTAPQELTRPEMPKILPGERLGDFAARVDHALPVGGLARKGKVKIEGVKERQTKTEKRMQKMYAAWREEEARRKEKEEERREQEEEAEDERDAAMGSQSLKLTSGSRNAKRRKMIGEQVGEDDDPWAELQAKRERPKGLHDVVQAPPSFKAVPKEKFKVPNGAKVNVENIPSSAGSLKRREELSGARKEVIERYRAMMKRES